MSTLMAIALTTGLLSGLWAWVAISAGLIGWAGFLGCTTYFASPEEGIKGVLLSAITNTSGVFWGMMIINSSAISPHIEIVGYVLTAIVSFFMCIQAKQRWLGFIPGTFIGCCATFASGGHWKLVLPSLLVGIAFGYAMKASGLWLQQRLQPRPVMNSQYKG